jgi:MFS family permease
VILLSGFAFFILASCSAAFIPSVPFQSPLSHIIAFNCNKLVPCNRKWRLTVIGVPSVVIAVAANILVAYGGGVYWILFFLPILGTFAIAEQKPSKSDRYSPIYGPPELVMLCGILFIPIALALSIDTTHYRAIYITVSAVGVVLLAFYGYSMDRLTQEVPDMLQAEAIAWLLESPRPKESESELFEKARRIASTPQRKALLLKTLLPLLPQLIATRVRNLPSELEARDLQSLLSSMAHLLDFNSSKRSLRWNKAAVKRPQLSDELDKQLDDQLRELKASTDPRLRDVAEFIWSHYKTDFVGEKTADKA